MAAATPPRLVLYSYWRSSCSYRVRIALHLKHLAFETRAVSLLKDGGQQLADDFARVNPMRAVPALVVGGATLTQSPAILEYLEEAFPDRTPLLPRDPLLRAKVRELCSIVACDTQPPQNLRVLKHVASFFEDPAEKEARRLEWAQRYVVNGMRALEALMSASAGRYSVGDEVTLADATLVPQVYNAARFKVDMAPFPTVARVYAACMELEAFRAAQPSAQPDAEAET